MFRTIAVAAFLAGMSGSATAGFGVTVSGNSIQISPPADATAGNLQLTDADGTDLYTVWFESSGNIPAGGFDVDHDGRLGTFSGDQFQDDTFTADLATTLNPGKSYLSYLIHFDPVQNYTVPTGPVAKLTFDRRIIGLSLFGASLDAGDAEFGAAGTTYATGHNKRGLDPAKVKDAFTISAFGKILMVDLTANGSGFDEIRVFTSAPEWSALSIWLVMGIVIAASVWWRQRNWAKAG